MARAAQSQRFHAPSHLHHVKVSSALTALTGGCMLISAWIRDLDIGNQLNGIIAGGAALILGTVRYCNVSATWASKITTVIGMWFIISPWLYRYAGDRWMWNSLLGGIALVLFGLWSSVSSDGTTRHNL